MSVTSIYEVFSPCLYVTRPRAYKAGKNTHKHLSHS